MLPWYEAVVEGRVDKCTHRGNMVNIRLQHHRLHRLLDRPFFKLIVGVLIPYFLEIKDRAPEMFLDKR